MMTSRVWRVLCGVMLAWMLVGCAQWEQKFQADLQRIADQRAGLADSGADGSGAGAVVVDETTDADRIASVEEARAQVLSFIHRLDDVDDTDRADHSEQDSGAAAGTYSASNDRQVRQGADRQGKSWTRHRDGDDEKQNVARHTGSASEVTAGTASPVALATNGALSIEPVAEAPRVVSVSLRVPPTHTGRGKSDQHPGDDSGDAETFNTSHSGTHRANETGMPGDHAMSPVDGAGLLAAMESQAARLPADASLQWRLGLLRLALGDKVLAMDVSEELSEDKLALVRKGLQAVLAIEDAVGDPVVHSDTAVEAIEDVTVTLLRSATLSIPSLKMCKKVSGFGVYEELDTSAFRAFSANQVIVYLEVDRFSSETMEDGRFRTLLSDRFEILTSDGESIWSHEEASIEDKSLRRRQDFFMAQRIVMPTNMDEGDYVLKVTVEDLLAEKRSQRILPFTIGKGSGSRQAAASRR